MRPRRLLRAILVLAAGAALGGAFTAPPLSALAAPVVPAGVSVIGGVDDFTFDAFDAVYELSRDGSGRSVLETTEHLVARFPDFDQNRGIIRALVTSYDGHDTSLRIQSITDENGNPRDYSTESGTDSNGETILYVTIAVPRGQFVHGEQHYVIRYTQRDVTKHFADTDDDEFYWDVNGDGWRQPFGRVTATVEVAEDLRPALIPGEACYWGYGGSTARCEIAVDDGVYRARAEGLQPYQNMTVVVPFRSGTFASAPITSYVPLPSLIGIVLIVGSFIASLVLRFVVWRNRPGRGLVIAQYEPPEGISPMLAANLVGKPKRGMAASILDLAVSRKVRMVEREQGWRRAFGVQKLDEADLTDGQRQVMQALFGGYVPTWVSGVPGLRMLGVTPDAATDVGEVRWLTRNDTSLGRRVVSMTRMAQQEAIRRGLRRKPPALPTTLVTLAMFAGLGLLFFTTFATASELAIILAVVGINAGVWLAIFSLGALWQHRPLTEEGSRIVEHLHGLREYIRLAEADRLQMLQSVTGAQRVADGDAQVIRIYERLLPYAVLFGLEKEWAAELAKYYSANPPDWYSGSSPGFHVAAFSAGVASFTASVSTSYSGSSSGSSSSGGSGGGGSSGGGGGGGGGGGV